MDLPRAAEPLHPAALVPVRVGIAAVFMVTGLAKLLDMGGTAAFFAQLGIPFPGTFAVLVMVAELFGGLGILLGVLARFSAAVLAVNMLVAILVAKAGQPFHPGWDLDALLALGCLAIAVFGPGWPTVWGLLGHPEWDPERRVGEKVREAARARA